MDGSRFQLGHVHCIRIFTARSYISNLTGDVLRLRDFRATFIIVDVFRRPTHRYGTFRGRPGYVIGGSCIGHKVCFLIISTAFQITGSPRSIRACAQGYTAPLAGNGRITKSRSKGIFIGRCCSTDSNAAASFCCSTITDGYAAAAIKRIAGIVRFRTGHRTEAQCHGIAAPCLGAAANGHSGIIHRMGIIADGYGRIFFGGRLGANSNRMLGFGRRIGTDSQCTVTGSRSADPSRQGICPCGAVVGVVAAVSGFRGMDTVVVHIDLRGRQFQLGHVDSIRILGAGGHIVQLAGNGGFRHITLFILFFSPSKRDSLIRGIPGGRSVLGRFTCNGIKALDILVRAGFGIFANDNGIGSPGIGSFTNSYSTFSPSSTAFTDSYGISICTGTGPDGYTASCPGTTTANGRGIGTRCIRTNTYSGCLVATSLDTITHSRTGIESFCPRAYTSTATAIYVRTITKSNR